MAPIVLLVWTIVTYAGCVAGNTTELDPKLIGDDTTQEAEQAPTIDAGGDVDADLDQTNAGRDASTTGDVVAGSGSTVIQFASSGSGVMIGLFGFWLWRQRKGYRNATRWFMQCIEEDKPELMTIKQRTRLFCAIPTYNNRLIDRELASLGYGLTAKKPQTAKNWGEAIDKIRRHQAT